MLRTAIDRAKYEVCYRLWTVWHCRLPYWRPFMRWIPPEWLEFEGGQHLIERGYYRHWGSVAGSRPWWHLCCNGDAGGWRTRVCNFLEYRWRSSEYYNRPELLNAESEEIERRQ